MIRKARGAQSLGAASFEQAEAEAEAASVDAIAAHVGTVPILRSPLGGAHVEVRLPLRFDMFTDPLT
ncbi:MAG: hypothetical protein U5N21_14770 [Rhodococcus sp. (in: high G+C Gram-positive bacteria)]|nr:hypothetical protein [Rhodococcus sp. (in: high G+C Gram-positive bacteria)]